MIPYDPRNIHEPLNSISSSQHIKNSYCSFFSSPPVASHTDDDDGIQTREVSAAKGEEGDPEWNDWNEWENLADGLHDFTFC